MSVFTMRAPACIALLVAGAALGTEAPPTMDYGAYQQPTWDRRDEAKSQVGGTEIGVRRYARERMRRAATTSQVHSLLEQAAVLHQEGELEKAVQLYKQVIKIEPLGEAYATLSKVLADQGKHDLSEKARLKATRLHNEQLARSAGCPSGLESPCISHASSSTLTRRQLEPLLIRGPPTSDEPVRAHPAQRRFTRSPVALVVDWR